MAQQYDTIGKNILNERINEIAQFVLNVPDVEVIADLDTEQWVQRCIDATLVTNVDLPTKANLLYGLSLFGGLVHNPDLFEQIPEELMQESSVFQHQREKLITQGAKETTLKNLLTVLNAKFDTEEVRTLVPALENIDDLQRLEKLHLAAVKAESLESFTETLFE